MGPNNPFLGKRFEKHSFDESRDNFQHKNNFRKNEGGRHHFDNKFKNKNHKFQNNRPPRQVGEATPWLKFKDEMQHNKRSNLPQLTPDEKQKFLKERKQNHKKFLIETKAKEETVWENFDGDEDNVTSSEISSQVPGTSKTYVKSKQIESNEVPRNIDKHKFRQVITKTTMKSHNMRKTLKQAIIDMKRHGVMQTKQNHSKQF